MTISAPRLCFACAQGANRKYWEVRTCFKPIDCLINRWGGGILIMVKNHNHQIFITLSHKANLLLYNQWSGTIKHSCFIINEVGDLLQNTRCLHGRRSFLFPAHEGRQLHSSCGYIPTGVKETVSNIIFLVRSAHFCFVQGTT